MSVVVAVVVVILSKSVATGSKATTKVNISAGHQCNSIISMSHLAERLTKHETSQKPEIWHHNFYWQQSAKLYTITEIYIRYIKTPFF